MAGKVSPIPEGYRTITPYLVLKGAAEAIDLYAKAFGAVELIRLPGPDGSFMHAEVKIGDSILMLSDEFPDWGQLGPIARGGVDLHDHALRPGLRRLVPAGRRRRGRTATQPPKDEFWGDRFAKVTDPFGHQWAFATHIEDVSPEEMATRMAAMGPPC